MPQVMKKYPVSSGHPEFTFSSTQGALLSSKVFLAEGFLTSLQSTLTHLLLVVLSIVLGVPL